MKSVLVHNWSNCSHPHRLFFTCSVRQLKEYISKEKPGALVVSNTMKGTNSVWIGFEKGILIEKTSK